MLGIVINSLKPCACKLTFRPTFIDCIKDCNSLLWDINVLIPATSLTKRGISHIQEKYEELFYGYLFELNLVSLKGTVGCSFTVVVQALFVVGCLQQGCIPEEPGAGATHCCGMWNVALGMCCMWWPQSVSLSFPPYPTPSMSTCRDWSPPATRKPSTKAVTPSERPAAREGELALLLSLAWVVTSDCLQLTC